MRILARVCLAVMMIIACSIEPAVLSQQPDAARPSAENDKAAPALKTSGYEVALPVTVRDKKGVLVTNLQKTDFALTEEGRPQTIKSFTSASPLPLRIGLLIDTSRSTSAVLDSTRKAAGKFLDLMLAGQPGEGKETAGKNQVFLIHFDREVELIDDFTDSRDKLHHDLDEMGSTRQAQNDTQGPETTGEDKEDRPRGGRAGDVLYDAIFLASDEVMAPKDGRKALIVLSDGVDSGSKDRLSEAIDAAEKANVSIYTIYYKGERSRDEAGGFPNGGHGHGGGYPGGYPGGGYPGGGYPGGGYPGGGRRGGSDETGVDGRKIMQQIAERTGAHAYEAKKKDDIEAIFNLIAEELHGQYVLTYTPEKQEQDGEFRKIALHANRADLTVVTREGYFAPGGESSK
jgi:VWFA-related protein